MGGKNAKHTQKNGLPAGYLNALELMQFLGMDCNPCNMGCMGNYGGMGMGMGGCMPSYGCAPQLPQACAGGFPSFAGAGFGGFGGFGGCSPCGQLGAGFGANLFNNAISPLANPFGSALAGGFAGALGGFGSLAGLGCSPFGNGLAGAFSGFNGFNGQGFAGLGQLGLGQCSFPEAQIQSPFANIAPLAMPFSGNMCGPNNIFGSASFGASSFPFSGFPGLGSMNPFSCGNLGACNPCNQGIVPYRGNIAPLAWGNQMAGLGGLAGLGGCGLGGCNLGGC